MPFNITLVRSRIKTRPYAKIDGAYSGPTWNNNIGLQTVPDPPAEAFKLLQTLSSRPDTCMVMGTAIRPEIMDTDRTLKNFAEEPVRMMVFDLDKYESPNMVTHGKKITYDLAVADAKDFIAKYLPPEFQDVTFFLRFSSSFLIKRDSYLRCHIIFILEESQYPREIGMWIKHENIPADATFYFNLTQPIFTAAPIWRNMVDPLKIADPPIPRIGIATGGSPMVPGGWQPYHFEKYKDPINIANLPSAAQLPGKMGSFCRSVPMSKILMNLGYTEESDGRWLAPNSSTGIPGVIVFQNGFAFSHHEEDPMNQVVGKVFQFKRRSLNAYDLYNGWATLNKDDPDIMGDFEFMLEQAILGDVAYQEEVQTLLKARAEWLTEGSYEGTNRKIIDGIVMDMNGMSLTNVARDNIFSMIKAKTKYVNKKDLQSLWKNVRKDQALRKDEYDPESNLRHMAGIFKRQKIIYSHHKTATGDYWCYFGNTRIWKRCNHTQARAFVYNHIHSSMPIKVEIDFTKMEHLTTLILRETCLSMADFRKGRGWAFRGGKYGIDMEGLFGDFSWEVNKAVKTLNKKDHICKELPITYDQWIATGSNLPIEYIDFLVASCEEDMESVELLREYGGYILADSYYLHKMLILEGVPGSGKSILAKILQAAVGQQYCSAISIAGMTTQFGLGELPGKKLAVMSEARSVDMKSLRALVPVLLKIIGQDYIDTEAKHKNAMTELLECKILMMTNRTPVIPDDTGALSQRLMMARFNRGFRDTKDEILGLDRIILDRGLAGIIKWHLIGLGNLSDRKHFIEPMKGVVAKQSLLEQIDPLKTFIEDFCYIDLDSGLDMWVGQTDFIRFFRAFLRRIGQYTENDFDRVRKRASIRNIRSLYPKVSKRKITRERTQVWVLQYLVMKINLEEEFDMELQEIE